MIKKNIVISGITKGIGASIAATFLNNVDFNVYGFARNTKTIVDEVFKDNLYYNSRDVSETEGLFTKQIQYAYFDVIREELSYRDINQCTMLCVDSIDAKKPEEIKAFCQKIISLKNKNGYNYQKTDILINNVGIYKTGSLFSEPDAQWQELFDVNVHSAYYLTKYLYPTFQKGTHIFNICSVASKHIVQEAPSYSITKMALYGLTTAMRQELEPIGVKVTAILPGAVNTHSWKDAPSEIQNKIIPAQDIANLVWDIYSLSPQSGVKEVEITPLIE